MESIGIGRGAQRACVVARGRRRHRRPGRGARLAEADSEARRADVEAADAPANVTRAEPRDAGGTAGLAGEQHSAASRLRDRAADPAAWTGKCGGHAAQRCPGARGFCGRPADRRRRLAADRSACSPRSGCPADEAYSASLVLLSRARRADERRRPRGLRRDRPQPHRSGPAQAADPVRRRPLPGTCSANGWSRRADTSTRSRACARSPPSTPAI